MGPYDIKNYTSELTVVFTNKIITTPVRGAGRPQGIYIVERMLDIGCKELGLDPLETRRLNFRRCKTVALTRPIQLSGLWDLP